MQNTTKRGAAYAAHAVRESAGRPRYKRTAGGAARSCGLRPVALREAKLQGGWRCLLLRATVSSSGHFHSTMRRSSKCMSGGHRHALNMRHGRRHRHYMHQVARHTRLDRQPSAPGLTG